MGCRFLLGFLLMPFLPVPSFSQDTIYLDKKDRWLDGKENAFRYCVQTELSKENIEVKIYNLGDTLLYLHHFSEFVDNPKRRVLNGKSIVYYADGQPSDTYTNVKGKKEGEYCRFYKDGKLKYRCHFIKDKREGLVEMYYPDGTLWRTEEFKKGVSQGGHVYDKEGKKIDFYPSERMAVFPGGSDALLSFMKEHIRYPEEAASQHIEGRVIVQLVFDKGGRIKGYNVLPESVDNYYLRAEAIRFVEEDLMKIEWEPAVRFGEFIRIRYTVPVTFKLQARKALK